MTDTLSSPAKPRARRRSTGREPLTRDQLVASAIAIADAEGLDAVTIRRLAADHGVTPMALYWHVKDKDELLDAIAEHLFATMVLPEPSSRPWTDQLREIFAAFLVSVRPHPEVAGLAMTRIFGSPAGLEVTERTLAELRRGGFTVERSSDIACYALAALIALVRAEPACGPNGVKSEEATRAKRALLTSLPHEQYPNVVASSDTLAGRSSRDSYFSLGLDLLIGGIQANAPKRAAKSA